MGSLAVLEELVNKPIKDSSEADRIREEHGYLGMLDDFGTMMVVPKEGKPFIAKVSIHSHRFDPDARKLAIATINNNGNREYLLFTCDYE